MGVRKKNVRRMLSYIKDIDESLFSMDMHVDKGQAILYEPLTVSGTRGDVIGHCVHLDTRADFPKKYMSPISGFDYYAWSIDYVFTSGTSRISRETIWEFMFGSAWTNSIEEAIARMQYVLEHGRVPEWFDPIDIDTYHQRAKE